jgi:antitoxin (DNA-binding transcriptional repressor) of toxin-antitoxin stability system
MLEEVAIRRPLLRETTAYDRYMAAVHISEAELAQDLHAVLELVRQGSEVVVEQDRRPVAIMKPGSPPARTVSEIIAAMEASGASGTVDEDFARDVEESLSERSEPWNPPAWD